MITLKEALNLFDLACSNDTTIAIRYDINSCHETYFTIKTLKEKFDIKNTNVIKIATMLNSNGYDTVRFTINNKEV